MADSVHLSSGVSVADATKDYDQAQFGQYFLQFGVAAFVLGLMSLCMMHFGYHYKLSRIQSFFAKTCLRSETSFAWRHALLVPFSIVFLLGPFILVFSLGITVAMQLDPPMVGVATLLCGGAIMLTVYGVLYWKSTAWRLTRMAAGCLLLAFLFLMGYEVAAVLSFRPFTYVGISAVFLSFNVIPMILIHYLHARGFQVDFEKFLTDEDGDGKANYVPPSPWVRRLKTLTYALFALVFLIIYASLVKSMAEPAYSHIGFFTAGAVLVIDMLLFWYSQFGFLSNPWQVCLVEIIIRLLLVFMGPDLWFESHSVVYVALAVFLGVAWVDDFLPLPRRTGGQDDPSPLILDYFLDHEVRNLKTDMNQVPEERVQAVLDDLIAKEREEKARKEEDAKLKKQQELEKNSSSSYDSSSEYSSSSYVSEQQEGSTEDAGTSVVTSVVGSGESMDTNPKAALKANDSFHVPQNLNNPFKNRLFFWFMCTICYSWETLMVYYGNKGGKTMTKDVVINGNTYTADLFAIASVLAAIFIPCIFAVYRTYARANYTLNSQTLVLLFVTEVLIVGEGVFFYQVSNSIVGLATCIFVPIIAVSIAVLVFEWIKNDYYMLSFPHEREAARELVSLNPKKEEDLPADVRKSLWTMRKKPEKYQLYCGLFLHDWLQMSAASMIFVATLGYALTMSQIQDPEWIGWTIGFGVLILILTGLPCKRWFNTFHFDVFSAGCVILCLILLGLYGALMWTLVLESQREAAVVVVLGVILYPVVVLLLVGLYEWYDARWKASRFTVVTIGLGFFCLVGFGVAIIAIFPDDWLIGACFLAAVVTIYYFIIMLVVWVSNDFYLSKPWRVSICFVVLLIILGGVAVGVLYDGFAGFSVAWLSLFVMVTFMSINKHLDWRNNPRQLGLYILPVYKYKRLSQTVKQSNFGTITAFVALMMAIFYGVAATNFIAPPWIGLGLSSLFIALFVLFCVQMDRLPAMTFGQYIKYVDDKMLADAAHAIALNEMGGVAGKINVSSNEAYSAGTAKDSYSYENSGYNSSYESEMQETSEYSDKSYGNYSSKNSSDKGHGYSETSSGVLGRLAGSRSSVDSSDADVIPVAKPAVSTLEKLARLEEFEKRKTTRSDYLSLFEMDEDINFTYGEESRFLALLQLEVLNLAEGLQRRDLAIIQDLLRANSDYKLLTDNRIGAWNDDDWDKFEEDMEDFLTLRKAEELYQEMKKKEEEEANRKREEHFKKLQAERKKKVEAEREARQKEKQKEKEKRRKEKERRKKERERKKLEYSSPDLSTTEPTEPSSEEESGIVPAAGPAVLGGDNIEIGDSPDDIAKRVTDGEKWEDAEFPADATSLYVGESGVSGSVVGWKRPEQFRGVKDPVIFDLSKDGKTRDIAPGDICQGALGDCWLLSAIAALSLRPELVENLFVKTEVSEKGVYCVKFWRNGTWERVCVDDRFPANEYGEPAYGHSVNPNELWVMIIEKAYAKWQGSYAALNGGIIHLGLVDMTGGSAESFSLIDEDGRRDILNGALWAKMLAFHKAKYLMGVGSHAGSDTNSTGDNIVLGHNYTILDVVEVDGNKLIKIRNPWGQFEWNGDWSDQSDKWTRRLKTKLGFEEKDDGIFWMSFDDFTHKFRGLYVCRIFDDSYCSHRLSSEWKGKTAGGCPNFPTVADNPQFFLSISRPTQVFISLSRDSSNTSVTAQGFLIYSTGSVGERVNPRRIKAGQKVASSGPYNPRREVSTEISLDKGVYAVVPTTFEAGQECEFIISAFSTTVFDFVPDPNAE